MAGSDLGQLLAAELPVALQPYRLPASSGLVIVDEVNGFCTVGAGNLAPPAPDQRIAAMVERTVTLARSFIARRQPVLAFLDTHEAGRPEPPYPPHCVRGTGEEELVPELAWLADDPDVSLVRKDCINGFVGAIELTSAKGQHGLSRNRFVDWATSHRLEAVVVVGICTDICVMDLVLTVLSARNHRLIPTLRDVVVWEPACATYDLSREAAAALALPATATHPRAVTHHAALYFMAARGAILAGELA
jgi:nicotinamidase-related amidase